MWFPDPATITVPKGARLLTLHHQEGIIYGWFFVNAAQFDTEQRTFRIFATGETIPNEAYKYIGSVHVEYHYANPRKNKHFVWHVVEDISE